MDKNDYREKIKQIAKKMKQKDYCLQYGEITENLHKHPSWINSNTIGITVSMKHEINTLPIIEQAWKEGKRVAVPKCIPAGKMMDFRVITSFDQLEVVYYGIKEPKESETNSLSKDQLDLIIVPGLCFDKNGYRIGHGGGYYDRFLKGYKGKMISLAFDYQLFESLPHDTYDIPIHEIISSKGIIETYG